MRKRLLLTFGLWLLPVGVAQAQCPNALINGTPANAGDVMNWLGCKASLTGAQFSGPVGVTTTNAQDLLDLGSGTAGRGIAWGGPDGSGRYSNIFSSYSAAGLVLAAGFKGSTSDDIYLSTYGSSIARAGIRLSPFGSGAGMIQFFTDAPSVNSVGSTVSPTERVRITSAGNVGIGTPSPAYTLEVNGSVAGVGAYVNTSDARLKGNVTPIRNALASIGRLQGVYFEWRRPVIGRWPETSTCL